LELHVIIDLNIWFRFQHDRLLRYQADWPAFYGADDAGLVKAVNSIVMKLLTRLDGYASYPLFRNMTANFTSSPCYGADWHSGEARKHIFELFSNFTALAIRIAEVDIAKIKRQNDISLPLSCERSLATVAKILELHDSDRYELWKILANGEFLEAFLQRSELILKLVDHRGVQVLLELSTLFVERGKCGPDVFRNILFLIKESAKDLSSDAVAPKFANGRQLHARLFNQQFELLSQKLCEHVGKETDSLPHFVRLDLYGTARACLTAAVIFDDKIFAHQAEKQVVNWPADVEKEGIPLLLGCVWSINLCKQFLAKGYMKLRVWAAKLLNEILRDTWAFFQQPLSGKAVHAVTTRVAQLLIDEKILDIILGVDSHPQVIGQICDTVLFLSIAHLFGKPQARVLCGALTRTQDEHALKATFQLCDTLVDQPLFPLDDILTLCSTMSEADLPEFTAELPQLLLRLRRRLEVPDWKGENGLLAIQAFIRFLHASAVSSSPFAERIQQESFTAIQMLSKRIPENERRQLFRSCIDRIKAKDDARTHFICALSAMCGQPNDDIGKLVDDENLIEVLCEDICLYVSEMGNSSADEPTAQDFDSRLSLLFDLIRCRPGSVSGQLFDTLWDHLVGERCPSNSLRDEVWKRLIHLTRIFPFPSRGRPLAASDNATNGSATVSQSYPALALQQFLDSCIDKLAENIQPGRITMEFSHFVRQAVVFRNYAKPAACDPQTKIIEISGLELLWQILFASEDEAVADHASEFVASSYLDDSVFSQVCSTGENHQEVAAATHTYVVNRCITKLKEIVEAEGERNHPADLIRAEVIVRRAFTLLSNILLHIQRKQQFFTISSPTIQPQASLPHSEATGKLLQIRYSIHSHPSPLRTGVLTVSERETLGELHMRLVALVNQHYFRIFWLGPETFLLNRPMQDLRSFGAEKKGPLVINLGPNPHQIGMRLRGPIPAISRNRTVFERQIDEKFEELYSLMEGKERISSMIYDFLGKFPPNADMQRRVACPDVSFSDIFPHGSPFKSMYSLRCLEFQLNSESAKNPDYIRHGIRLLETALLDDQAMDLSLRSDADLALNAETIKVIIAFLYADTPSATDPFEQAARLAQRIANINRRYLEMTPRRGFSDQARLIVAWQCFELLLLVVAHSSEAWNEVKAGEQYPKLIFDLLTNDSTLNFRITIADILRLSIVRHPTSSHLSKTELLQYFYSVLSELTTNAAQQSRATETFFGVLRDILVLRFENQELGNSERETLELHLKDWANLLLTDRLVESVVALGAIDPYLLSLSQVVKVCLNILKEGEAQDFEEAKQLRDSIFWDLLYPIEGREHLQDDNRFPVLADENRSILYEILLLLTPNTDELPLLTLLNNLNQAIADDETIRQEHIADRSKMLRTFSKHIGIFNMGATCFMNSLIAQLYMSPEFRNFVTELPREELSLSNDVFEMLQMYFWYMQESYYRALSGNRLIERIRDIEGNNISPYHQMDVEEFQNLLFDQLESNLLSSPIKHRFRKLLGGIQVTQIKSKECDHVSEREEPFFTIQCPLEGSTCLEDSLGKLVKGEELEGGKKLCNQRKGKS
jgi:ubiquitin carboxyl-terminal hydrolase 34